MPVYMVRAGQHGPVKIGFAEDISLRLTKMQADNHERLTVLRKFVGGTIEELSLHLRFADQRLHGEWFAFTRLMLGDVGLEEILPESGAEPPKMLRRGEWFRICPTSRKDDAVPPPEVPSVATETQIELLTEIEAFLPQRNIRETTFGRLAVNDGKFVMRLRRGDNMTLATMGKARSFIRDNTSVAA